MKDQKKQILEFQSRWKHLFDKADGEKRLEDIRYLCGMDKLSYVANDSKATSFNEGKKDFFLTFKRLLDIDPSTLTQTTKQEK